MACLKLLAEAWSEYTQLVTSLSDVEWCSNCFTSCALLNSWHRVMLKHMFIMVDNDNYHESIAENPRRDFIGIVVSVQNDLLTVLRLPPANTGIEGELQLVQNISWVQWKRNSKDLVPIVFSFMNRLSKIAIQHPTMVPRRAGAPSWRKNGEQLVQAVASTAFHMRADIVLSTYTSEWCLQRARMLKQAIALKSNHS